MRATPRRRRPRSPLPGDDHGGGRGEHRAMSSIGLMRVGPPAELRGTRRLTFGEVMEWVFLASSMFWPRLFIAGFFVFDHDLLLHRAFSSWLVPALGFLLLPWTTFTYAWMWGNSTDGVIGSEWVLVAAALALDLITYAAGYALSRRR